jgi:anti-sigma factor RsiW
MTDQEARQHLALYADGELDPRVAAELEDCLAKSPELRDELERWRALRRCGNRVITGTEVPPGLEDRVRDNLRRSRLGGRYVAVGWFSGMTAIAAAVALAVVLWPSESAPAGVKELAADRFADRFRRCACEHRCRKVDVDLSDVVAARDSLAQRKGHPVLLPDLQEYGFQLDGICGCFGDPDVKVVHVFYRRPGAEPKVVSVFSLDQKVHLKDCQCEVCRQGREGLRRRYEVAECENVVVYKWDEAVNSFAVCSDMSRQQLRDLADNVRLVRVDRLRPAFVWAHP